MGKSSNGASNGVSHGIASGARTIITGASTGIGKALAVQLAQKYQAKLVLNARHEPALNETKKLVQEAGGEATLVYGDISNSEMPQKLIDAALHHFGGLDILINNAGISRPGSMLDLSEQNWEEVFAVNFFAPLKLTRLALPHFIKNHRGTIVNLSSVLGKVAFPGSVCYAASKFALTGLSQGTAAEYGRQGVNVITVCPGWVRTEFFVKNKMSAERNPTAIAEKNDLSGLIMRHLLSISGEEAAKEIVTAMEKGTSEEIVLTMPGVAAERIAAIFPGLAANMAKFIPQSRFADEKEKVKVEVN
jgi:short-subunit dehydrogenase